MTWNRARGQNWGTCVRDIDLIMVTKAIRVMTACGQDSYWLRR